MRTIAVALRKGGVGKTRYGVGTRIDRGLVDWPQRWARLGPPEIDHYPEIEQRLVNRR